MRITSLPTHKAATTRRTGFTLLEVVLALGIFMLALAAVSEVLGVGARANLAARLETQAMLRAESKLAELAAGALPFRSIQGAPFTDDPQWTYSVLIAPTPAAKLLQVDVRVARQSTGRLANVSVALRKWMRDPQLFIDAANAAASKKSNETSQTSSGTTSSRPSSGTGGKK